MKFLTNLNLSGNQLLNAAFQNVAVLPGTGVEGQTVYHTGTGKPYIWSGGGWKHLGNGVRGGSSSSYIDGDATLLTTSGELTISQVNADITFGLANSGVVANTYGSASQIPVLTIDSKGRITGATTQSITTAISLIGDATGSGTTGSDITLTLANTGVSAGTFNNSTTQITPFTVDAKGRLTATGTPVTITPAWTSITGKPTTLGGYGITDAQPLDGDLTAIAGITGTGILKRTADDTWALEANTLQDVTGRGATTSAAISITNTTDSSTTTSGALKVSGGVGIAKKLNVGDDAKFGSNVVIDGNLTVNGTTVTISTTNLSVEDNMIYLNAGGEGTNPDLGIAGNYTIDSVYAHSGIFRDATDGIWKFYEGYTPEPGIAIDTTHASFAYAPLSVKQLISTVATGTAPLVVSSTTKVDNLNADLLDGFDSAYFAPLSSPGLVGTPTAPTASVGTDNTQIATTAFVNSTIASKKFVSMIGDSTGSNFVVTHNLGTSEVFVSVRETAGDKAIVYADVEITSNNSITLRFGNVPNLNEYTVVIMG